jgi:hypothetical protein
MKLSLHVIAIAALACVMAGSGSAKWTSFEGQHASAVMTVVEPDGCRQGTLRVTLDQSPDDEAPGHVFVGLDRRDTCTGTVLALGGDAIDLEPGPAFDFSTGARTVRLAATVEVFDEVSGTPIPVHVDLVWESTDRLAHETRSVRTRSDVLVFEKLRAGLREAVVSGFASDGTYEYTSGTVEEALTGALRERVLVTPGGGSGVSATRAGYQGTSGLLQALAVWERFDASGCVRNLGVVSIVRSFSSDETAAEAVFQFASFDQCQNNMLFDVSGAAPIDPGALTLAEDFSFADVDVTLDGTDFVSGTPVELTVDLRWQGVGNTTATMERRTATDGGVKTNGRVSTRLRSSVPTGTVTADGDDLLDGFPVGPDDLTEAIISEVVERN